MSRRDRLGWTLACFIGLGSIAGGLWYVRDHRAAPADVRMQVEGPIIGKRTELPGKRVYPVRYALVVQEPGRGAKIVYVDRDTYRNAAPGMRLKRDSAGNVSIH